MNNYIQTMSKAQLMRAIQAVPVDGDKTIIEAVNSAGVVLAKFTFGRTLRRTPEEYERHLKKIVGNVRRTPASFWQ